MLFSRRTLLVASLLVAAGPAQNLIPVYPPIVELDVGQASGTCGRVVSARLSGFGLDDIAFVRGGQAYLCTAPGIFSGATELGGLPPGSVVDIQCLPGGAVSGDDALAVVGSFGLGIWSLDKATGAGSFTAVDTSWGSVTEICVGDLEHDGILECVGFAAGSTSVLSVSLPPLPNAPPYATVTRGYDAPVLAAVAVDYDSALIGDELCVLTTTGIVVEGGPTPAATVASYPMLATQCTARRLVTTNGEYLVAWTNADLGGGPASTLLTLSSTVSPYITTDLQGMTVTGMVAADATRDGFDDLGLLFSGRDSYDTLLNTGTGSPLTPPTQSAPHLSYTAFGGVEVAIPLGATQNPGDRMSPALLDLDGDGDREFVLASGLSSSLTVGVNTWYDAGLMHPTLEAIYVPAQKAEIVRFEVPIVPGSTATHLEVLRWGIESTGSGLRLDPVASRVDIVPHTAGPVQRSLSVVPPPGDSHAGYLFMARMIEQDGAGNRVGAYPFVTFARPAAGSEWLVGASTIGGWDDPGGENSGIVTPLPEPPPPPPPGENETNGGG